MSVSMNSINSINSINNMNKMNSNNNNSNGKLHVSDAKSGKKSNGPNSNQHKSNFNPELQVTTGSWANCTRTSSSSSTSTTATTTVRTNISVNSNTKQNSKIRHRHQRRRRLNGKNENDNEEELELKSQESESKMNTQSKQTETPLPPTVTVSCHDMQYKIQTSSFDGKEEIIIGVLSGAGGSGPSRRASIRETWADSGANYQRSFHNFDNRYPHEDEKKNEKKNNKSSHDNSDFDYSKNKIKEGKIRIFFLVAGPWDDQISAEYHKYGDLIWIDEEEVYEGENSVLPYKTQSFIKIMHEVVTMLDLRHVKYIFKTDDDSYVHVNNLYTELIESENEYMENTVESPTTAGGDGNTASDANENANASSNASSEQQKHKVKQKKDRDFWGWCQLEKFAPKRDASVKWPVSYELYPESMYPPYCQGAGFAISRKFMECAASSIGNGNDNGNDNSHIANLRFMPFEDVSIGMIAERCNVDPIMVEKKRWINLYRTELEEEKERVREGMPKIDKAKLTRPIMLNRIVQHRIYDEWDMKEHHKIVLDPVRYNKESQVKWNSPPSK